MPHWLVTLTENLVKTHAAGEGEAEPEAETDNDIKTSELLQFDFETIRFATNNFSDENKLGQGGFGAVYKVLWNHGTS